MASNELPRSGAPILQERGRFWWADESLPTIPFAPEASAVGQLTIESGGRITLDFDGIITTREKSFLALLSRSNEAELETRKIQGLLKDSNKRVLLFELSRRGGRFSTFGISTDGFSAEYCLVG